MTINNVHSALTIPGDSRPSASCRRSNRLLPWWCRRRLWWCCQSIQGGRKMSQWQFPDDCNTPTRERNGKSRTGEGRKRLGGLGERRRKNIPLRWLRRRSCPRRRRGQRRCCPRCPGVKNEEWSAGENLIPCPLHIGGFPLDSRSRGQGELARPSYRNSADSLAYSVGQAAKDVAWDGRVSCLVSSIWQVADV